MHASLPEWQNSILLFKDLACPWILYITLYKLYIKITKSDGSRYFYTVEPLKLYEKRHIEPLGAFLTSKVVPQ